MGPAQISFGSLRELRMMEDVFPSCAREMLVPQRPAETYSWPRHRGSMRALAGSMMATAASPSTVSPKTIFASGVQASQLAVAFTSGVMFVGSPPVAGIVYTSPPTEGSSLMRPAMNAIFLPSGDHAGFAIWRGGL